MSELKHTPEPWGILGYDVFKIAPKDNARKVLLECSNDVEESGANASRIVACVNACAGMVDPQAEILALRQEVESLKIDRDRLTQKLQEDLIEYGQELSNTTQAFRDAVSEINGYRERAETAEAKVTQILADQEQILKSHTEEQERADKAEAEVARLREALVDVKCICHGHRTWTGQAWKQNHLVAPFVENITNTIENAISNHSVGE